MTTAEAPLILVVDDFADNREMYAEYLRFSGYRADEARDGHEALDKAVRLRPDLIVMDLSLPGVDGWEVTRRLKTDTRTKAIPVIAVTGFALGRHASEAREAGCDHFLTKPCTPDALVAAIRRVLEHRGARDELEASPKPKPKTGR
jgi:two-component system, cell cycle response regulator DivK